MKFYEKSYTELRLNRELATTERHVLKLERLPRSQAYGLMNKSNNLIFCEAQASFYHLSTFYLSNYKFIGHNLPYLLIP
ncbi:hypothetical protein [Aquirufa sp.]|jgi:hypothetical protein|uniref:hypothetical protein n=1 Tax=Aquirufa sp. TaxID=2676249 RepID=UPI0037C04C4C